MNSLNGSDLNRKLNWEVSMLLLSGEGRTDIGAALNLTRSICPPDEWVPGPMGILVDQLYKKTTGYSAIESKCAYFVSESALTQHAKTICHPSLRGKDHSLFHKKNAQALASLAFKLSAELQARPIIVVFFRDCDGTQSSPTSRHSMIYDSINGEKGGFRAVGLQSGVPMIPRPKSEAWLLCAVKENPFHNCQSLEALSGNDASPNSVKKQLQARLASLGDRACTLNCQDCAECKIDFNRIDMSSFNKFKSDFEEALRHNANTWRSPIDSSLAGHLGVTLI